MLAGDDLDQPGRSRVYIGEGDNVFQRIKLHNNDESKEFWDRVYLFVAKDDNLTKAHVRHLEARMVERAREAGRASLANGTNPSGGVLPEPDVADMDEFLYQAYLLCAALGLDAFTRVKVRHAGAPGSGPAGEASSPEAAGDVDAGFAPRSLELAIEGKGYSAKCLVAGGEFIVLAGSIARLKEASSLHPAARTRRRELLDAGVLQREPEGLRFVQDHAFRTPSAAATAVVAASVNGRVYWKLPDGRSYKEWQEAELG